MADEIAPELIEHVARALCSGAMEDPDWSDPESGSRPQWRNKVAVARVAIAAYEAFQAEARCKKAAAHNIAYLQANIAQCETFMARGKDADPIGHMQWASRKADFQRELDAALAAVDEPDAPAAS